MPKHRVGTQEEWQEERDKLLVEEKKITHRGDELTKQRQELPWVPVEKEYSFETDEGTKSLTDLFDGNSQLLIYHFMFGPVYEAGCTVCSSITDNLNPNVPHLKRHDTKLMLVSPRSHGCEAEYPTIRLEPLAPKPPCTSMETMPLVNALSRLAPWMPN